MSVRASVAAMAAVVMTAAAGGAAEPPSAIMIQPSPGGQGPAAESDPFAQDSWNLQLYGGAIRESFGGDNETLILITAAVEYFVWDDVAVVGELIGYGVDQMNPDSIGIGLNALGRWYPLQFAGGDLAFFIEGGVGVAQFSRRTPAPMGTHFNYTIHGGIGTRWRIRDNLSLLAALDYLHISNARHRGIDRNPSIDGFGGYGGLRFDF